MSDSNLSALALVGGAGLAAVLALASVIATARAQGQEPPARAGAPAAAPPSGAAPSSGAALQNAAPEEVDEADEADEADTPTLFGPWVSTIEPLVEPEGMAFAADGTLAICERGAHRVRLFDADGKEVRSIGSFGTGPGKFDGPADVAFGPDDHLYVVDRGNHRVQVFTRTGSFVGTWGSLGSEPGRFREPSAIAGHGASFWIADRGNHRIQELNRQGEPIRAVGVRGRGPDGFEGPNDVAVDEEGRVIVADSYNCRVSLFATDGTPLLRFGDYGPHVGLLGVPRGITAFEGRLFVADTRNHRVQVFTPDGIVLGAFGRHVVRPREGEGRLHYPERIAISPDGTRLAVAETFADRVQIFGRGPEPEDPTAVPGVEKGTHLGHAADAAGDLLVATELDDASVLVYDLTLEEPARIHDFGGYGLGVGRFLEPSGIALDAARSTIWVTDAANRRLSSFRLDREPGERVRYDPFLSCFVKSIDFDYSMPRIDGERQPVVPEGLAVHDDGRVFVCDSWSDRVWIYSSRLAPLQSFGTRGSGPGELRRPVDLAVDASGDRVWIVDAGNRRLQVFSEDGAFERSIGRYGADPGEFLDPCAVVAAPEGGVFVADRGAHRIQHFDSEGELVRSFGRKGLRAGEFFKPSALAIDARLRLYVVDLGNHRGQVFTTTGQFLDAFGSRLYVREAKRAE